MSSNRSPSNPSSERPRRRRRSRAWRQWPELVLLPALVAVVQVLAITPLLYLFFGEAFGLTGGRPVMWPGGIALLGLVGFWSAKAVQRITTDPNLFPIALGVAWLLSAAVWIGLEPAYGLQGLLAEPGSLVGSRGYLIAPLLLSLAVWWHGIRYATVDYLLTAEEVRGSTWRSWLVLIGSLVLSAMLDNEAGQSALSTTPFVVPALMIASVALVAAAEIHAARVQIGHAGGRPPTWSRWGRLVGGAGMVILVIAVLVLLVLTPGAFSAMIAGIVTVLRAVGQLVLWLLYGVFYILYYAFYALSEIFRALFDVEFGPMEPPEQAPGMPGELGPFEQREDQGPWEYAELVRWLLLGGLVVSVIFLLFRVSRRGQPEEDVPVGDEERSSVFSADLAKAQLRNLFRRGHRGSRLRRLDLESEPSSVRDTWRYLQVLALRQEVGRQETETPQDFVARLRAVWSGTGGSLNDLVQRYERSRYGDIESERDTTAAREDWADIYRRRRERGSDTS
ncbi:MAG TPA: DUF4129 domain-containing protein [Thermomicrobiales bacterium]|nr:DUF4129 domain-containing protein [Thermomicrobiales bacterium]